MGYVYLVVVILLNFIENLIEKLDCGIILIMIKEINDPQECPFRYQRDWTDYCNICDANCLWDDEFPEDCLLLKEQNILIKCVLIKKR